jgi:hypothetical protein
MMEFLYQIMVDLQYILHALSFNEYEQLNYFEKVLFFS